MKKLMYFSFMLILLFLVACGEIGGNSNIDIDKEEKWVLENVGIYIADDVDFPTETESGASLIWTYFDEFGDECPFVNTSAIERGNKPKDYNVTYYIDGEKGGELTIHLASMTLEEAFTKLKNKFPTRVNNNVREYFISRDIEIPTNYDGVITVEVESSNTDAFTNEGKYMKLTDETKVTLNVKVNDSYNEYKDSIELTVAGRSKSEILDDSIAWLDANFIDMCLSSSTVLPTSCPNNATITWTSSNEDVVTSDGKVTAYVMDRYVSLTAKINYDGAVKTKDYYCKVEAKDTTNMSEIEIIEDFLKAIGRTTFKQMNFSAYGNITQSYGFIEMYVNEELPIIEAFVPANSPNAPHQARVSTEYITVHDTANANASADALMHSNYIRNGSGGAETSWHYSVDDHSIYYQVPNNEIAWHAGDGSRLFKLIDTGVKATAKMPILTITEDGYFALGGEKTQIKIPSDAKVTTPIGPYGITTEIGPNGNYWMNNAYYNSTYGYICNQGGNRNSISMETCVNSGSDYVKTFRLDAKLVAYLCDEWDLSVDRVEQHNNFSGKPCPNAIRQAGEWAHFRDLVSINKFALQNMKKYDFNWTSKSATLSNTGVISLAAKKGDTISYSVQVIKNNVLLVEKSFSTLLK